MDVFNGTFGACNDSGSGALDMATECGVCGKLLARIQWADYCALNVSSY